jgi:8-oxo-dGTP pyrophosphatase MutT (NUDIX family)
MARRYHPSHAFLDDPLALAGTFRARRRPRAAVAVCLRERRGGAELLFIERARREGDPWSGHMAFPGGRVEPDDLSSRGAAERETFEEVGLPLAGAEAIGRLDDLRGREAAAHPTLVISAFVYHVPAPPELVLSDEVEQAFWFPAAPRGAPVDYRFGPGANGATWDPRRRSDRHVVWGLPPPLPRGVLRRRAPLLERPVHPAGRARPRG